MQELIDELNRMVAAGTKKSELEESIGLPENSLSAVLKGSKEMPGSWVSKIKAFLEKPIAQPEPEISPNIKVTQNGLTSTSVKEKMAALQPTIDGINKDFGAGTIWCLGDKPLPIKEVIPTGILGADLALGVGGFPRGRIVELYGGEASGKTTIALHVIAEAQKKNLLTAYIDAEHAFDHSYAQKLGVNLETLYMAQPDYGEQALEIADRAILSEKYAVIVIDSVAALIPKAELEGEMGDSKMGLQARLMSQACRKLVASINKSNTLVIFINQLRAVIGNMYGPQEITTGGNALKFYASIRIETRIGALLKDGEETIGRRIKFKVVKSKVAPPYKTAEFDILYGEGVDKIGEIVDIGVAKGIITKAGSWFSYNNHKLGQGRDSAKQVLLDNPDMLQEITKKIKENN